MNSLKDGIDKFIFRLKNKPIIKGVHTSCKPFGLGISIAGSYFDLVQCSKSPVPKRLHKEVLEELRLMPKPKLP